MFIVTVLQCRLIEYPRLSYHYSSTIGGDVLKKSTFHVVTTTTLTILLDLLDLALPFHIFTEA